EGRRRGARPREAGRSRLAQADHRDGGVEAGGTSRRDARAAHRGGAIRLALDARAHPGIAARRGAARRAALGQRRVADRRAAGVGAVVASLAGGTLVQSRPVLVIGMLVATVLFLLGVGWSIVAMVRIARSHDPGRAALGTAVALVSLATGTLFSLFGAFIAF